MVVLAGGLVAGCGGSDSGAARVGGADLSGTVHIWDTNYESFPGYTKVMNRLDAEFEQKNPGVTIDREAQPIDTYEALIRSAFASHEGPDIMQMEPGAQGVLSFSKGLEPLNGLITPEMDKELTAWSSATPGYTEEGERFGVPIGLFGGVFYYNKALFRQAGLPTKFDPQSWAEIRQAGEKLKAAGIQPFTGGNEEGYENLWWFSAGFHSEAEEDPRATEELAQGTLDWTDPAVAKAFQPEIEMEEAGLFPSDRFSTSAFSEGFPRFAEGQGAMILGLWNVAGCWCEFNPKLGEKNVGMFFAPGPESIETSATLALSIPKFAKNKDAAWAVIEFDSSRQAIQALVDEGDFMPNRKDVTLPSDAPVQERELVEAARHRETVVSPTYQTPSPVVFGPMTKGISEVLQGRMSLAEAQEGMQEAVEKTD
jgi:multiple sugar transport system substrate-binding protein